jgi:hypothetical protein
MRLVLVLCAICACGDNISPPLHIVADAAVDADLLDAAPDGYVPPHNPCCDLLPDEDAVRTCVGPLPPNTCGVIVCYDAVTGVVTLINVCGPLQ